MLKLLKIKRVIVEDHVIVIATNRETLWKDGGNFRGSKSDSRRGRNSKSDCSGKSSSRQDEADAKAAFNTIKFG